MWDVQSNVNNGTFTISTGAGFLPSTIVGNLAPHVGVAFLGLYDMVSDVCKMHQFELHGLT